MVAETTVALAACTWALVGERIDPPGQICEQLGRIIQDLFLKILAAILSLLVAAKTPPGPPPRP